MLLLLTVLAGRGGADRPKVDDVGDGRVVTVGVLFPKPMNVHQRKITAIRPRTAAHISFFFSPGFEKSANSIIAADLPFRSRFRFAGNTLSC